MRRFCSEKPLTPLYRASPERYTGPLHEALCAPWHLTQLIDAMADALGHGIPLEELCGLWLPAKPGGRDYRVECSSREDVIATVGDLFDKLEQDIEKASGRQVSFDAERVRKQLYAPLPPRSIRSFILAPADSTIASVDTSYETLAPFGAAQESFVERIRILCDAYNEGKIEDETFFDSVETCTHRALHLLPALEVFDAAGLSLFKAACTKQLADVRTEREATKKKFPKNVN